MRPPPDRQAYLLLGIAGGTLLLIMMLYFFMADSPPSLEGAIYSDATQPIDARVEDLLTRMTLDEKIGQMALIEKNSVPHIADVATYGIGAILSGAGGKPADNTPAGWKAMIARYVDASRASRTGIPIFYGLDANHGHSNVPGATVFPHAIGLGAANDASLVREIARTTAKEAAATGAKWLYSPSLDLPADIRWGRVYETFSDDPMRTAELGAAYVSGIEESAASSAKHFPGIGGMLWQTSTNKNFSIDQGAITADEAALRGAYLVPFQKAVESGATSVMAGLASWGPEKIAASRYLLTDILKGEMNFKGFVVSDWYGVYEISPRSYDSTVAAINAGVDMVMLPFDYALFMGDMNTAVRRGDISEARIDDAVRRILRAKFELGLFESTVAPELSVVGSEEHHALAREAVAKSLVLLKNDNRLLPLSSPRKIRVAGSAADNVGMQAGAWTVEWQGIDGNWLPGGTSILAGITEAAGSRSVVQYEKDGRFAEKDIADIGIAIVGEKPYAEGWGDEESPTLSEEDRAAIENLRASSQNLIVIIVSGRPLIITDDVAGWDALVAAWLPGSEGAGVADVLFGTKPFEGTLPLHWPRTLTQVPFDWTGRSNDGTPPLFPRGFGL